MGCPSMLNERPTPALTAGPPRLILNRRRPMFVACVWAAANAVGASVVACCRPWFADSTRICAGGVAPLPPAEQLLQVALKTTELPPATVAVTLTVGCVVPNLSVLLVCPLPPVMVGDALESVPPPGLTDHVTLWPDAGSPTLGDDDGEGGQRGPGQVGLVVAGHDGHLRRVVGLRAEAGEPPRPHHREGRRRPPTASASSRPGTTSPSSSCFVLPFGTGDGGQQPEQREEDDA